jgi:exopolysaccharide production protein ExoQ
VRNVSASSDLPISSLVVSWVLMIPLLCFASNGLLWFRAGASDNELASRFGLLATGKTGTAEAITILLFAIVPVLVFPKMKSVIELCRKDRVFAALAAWIMVSCLWSQFPTVSLEWAPVAALNIVFAFYLYRRFSPSQQIRLLLLLGWVCLVLSIFLSLCFPKYGIDYTGAWRGMYPHRNLCSMTTAFLLLGALYAPATSFLFRVFRVVYVCLSVFLILMTQSATGKITLVCLLAYFVATRLASRLHSKERAIALIVGTVIVLAFVGVGISMAREIALFLGKDPTFSGRTEIWQSIMPSIMKHPILGYGYRAFWRGYQGESANASFATHWAVTSAHNGFLEVWLTLGAVGVALVAYSLLRAIRDAFVCLRAGKSPYLGWYACIIFLTILTSVDEGELVIPNSLMWILYIFACVGLSEGARRIRLGLERG